MAPLTEDRNTPRAEGDNRVGPAAAATTIFAGSITMRNAAGNLTKGATATDLIGVGVAQKRVVNAGSAGAQDVPYRAGIYRFGNSTDADEIGAGDEGALCYAVDDQTVALTDGGGTRSPAGFIDHVDELGVFVRFDEAMVRQVVELQTAIDAIE